MVEKIAGLTPVVTIDEQSLVERATKRDPEAFGELYGRYMDPIYKYMLSRVGNPTDAEDLTEQVFFRGWKAIDRYKKMGRPFGVWLFRIGHNLLVDRYRAKKEEVYLSEIVDGMKSLTIGDTIPAGRDSDPYDVADRNLEDDKLRKAMAQLTRDKQAAVVMRYLEGDEAKSMPGRTKRSHTSGDSV